MFFFSVFYILIDLLMVVPYEWRDITSFDVALDIVQHDPEVTEHYVYCGLQKKTIEKKESKYLFDAIHYDTVHNMNNYVDGVAEVLTKEDIFSYSGILNTAVLTFRYRTHTQEQLDIMQWSGPYYCWAHSIETNGMSFPSGCWAKGSFDNYMQAKYGEKVHACREAYHNINAIIMNKKEDILQKFWNFDREQASQLLWINVDEEYISDGRNFFKSALHSLDICFVLGGEYKELAKLLLQAKLDLEQAIYQAYMSAMVEYVQKGVITASDVILRLEELGTTYEEKTQDSYKQWWLTPFIEEFKTALKW